MWVVQRAVDAVARADRIDMDLAEVYKTLRPRTNENLAHACRVVLGRAHAHARSAIASFGKKPGPKVSFVRPFYYPHGGFIAFSLLAARARDLPQRLFRYVGIYSPTTHTTTHLVFSFSKSRRPRHLPRRRLLTCSGHTFFDCSLRVCPADCSGKGACFDGTCRCEEGFCGADCALKCCPADCSGHGECDQTEEGAVCRCQPGYGGVDCSLRRVPERLFGQRRLQGARRRAARRPRHVGARLRVQTGFRL